MADQYCATPEQWSNIEQLASSCVYDLVILELRDRLAVAEQRIQELEQRPISGSVELVADPLLDTKEMVIADEGLERIFYDAPGEGTAAEGLRAVYDLGRQHGANSSVGLTGSNHPAKPDSSPAPAGGLVERVAHTIHDAPSGYGYENEAYAAILAVAEWLRKRGRGNAACELEQEVERG
jgi:hypothetical protein